MATRNLPNSLPRSVNPYALLEIAVYTVIGLSLDFLYDAPPWSGIAAVVLVYLIMFTVSRALFLKASRQGEVLVTLVNNQPARYSVSRGAMLRFLVVHHLRVKGRQVHSKPI